MEEKDILEAISEDKEYGFKMLVEKYQNLVLNLAYSLSRDFYLAQDIAQEVFIKIFKKINSFRKEAKLSTWIYRIALNMSYKFLKRRKTIPLEKASPLSLSTTLSEPPLKNKKELIREAINRLPIKYRTVIVLKDLENFSYKDIAKLLRCRIGTVESRLFRARKLLKKFLEPLIKEGL